MGLRGVGRGVRVGVGLVVVVGVTKGGGVGVGVGVWREGRVEEMGKGMLLWMRVLMIRDKMIQDSLLLIRGRGEQWTCLGRWRLIPLSR